MKKGRHAGLKRARFKALVGHWAGVLRVHPTEVRVQHMTRKWGSCSPAGRLSFAAELLARPRRFQERVILHELLHLRVPNHGRLHRAYVSAYSAGLLTAFVKHSRA